MSSILPIPEREAQAKREIGHTEISRSGTWSLIVALLIIFLLGTGAQLMINPEPLRNLSSLPLSAENAWEGEGTGTRLFRANRALLGAMESWEDQLEDEAWFRPFLLRHGQPLLWQLGSGNGKAVRGLDGWLLFQPDIDYVTAEGFDTAVPRKAILDFAEQLSRRGIRLVIVPVPVKPQIHPESLTRHPVDLPLRNPSETALFTELASKGIPVVDLAAEAKDFRYLKTDTHWSPETMHRAAELTAEALRGLEILPQRAPVPYEMRNREITHLGDIAEMLALPDDQTLISPERIEHKQVLQDEAAPRVLLLGDSFSNIYSLEGMGWGVNGGFSEHLGVALGEPVRSLIRNDAGASATREMLAQDLARGRDRLEGIQVVVWEFASRELLLGDWYPIEMELRESNDPLPDATVMEGFESFTGMAMVTAISDMPRPGQVPYADHVVTLHLSEMQSADGNIRNGEAVVRALSMKDHSLTEVARLRPGNRISVSLLPFAEVEETYGSLNVSVLDNPDFFLLEPFWMETFTP